MKSNRVQRTLLLKLGSVAVALLLSTAGVEVKADNQDHGPVYTVGQRVWFDERGCFEFQPGAGAWSGSGDQASWSPFVSCEQIDRDKAYVQAEAKRVAEAAARAEAHRKLVEANAKAAAEAEAAARAKVAEKARLEAENTKIPESFTINFITVKSE